MKSVLSRYSYFKAGSTLLFCFSVLHYFIQIYCVVSTGKQLFLKPLNIGLVRNANRLFFVPITYLRHWAFTRLVLFVCYNVYGPVRAG